MGIGKSLASGNHFSLLNCEESPNFSFGLLKTPPSPIDPFTPALHRLCPYSSRRLYSVSHATLVCDVRLSAQCVCVCVCRMASCPSEQYGGFARYSFRSSSRCTSASLSLCGADAPCVIDRFGNFLSNQRITVLRNNLVKSE